MSKFEGEYSRENYDKAEQEEADLKARITKAKSADKILESAAKLKRVEIDKDEMISIAQDEAHLENFENEERNLKEQIAEATVVGDTNKIIELDRRIKELEIQQNNRAFLFSWFSSYYNSYKKKATQKVRFAKPTDLDYGALSKNINPQKFGEYTVNPDVQDINFETAKPFILDDSKFVGVKGAEIIEYVVKTYSTTHHIPGIEYLKWLIEEKEKGNKVDVGRGPAAYFFPGSVFCGPDGRWFMPGMRRWGGNDESNEDFYLDDVLENPDICKIVLLEKQNKSGKE